MSVKCPKCKKSNLIYVETVREGYEIESITPNNVDWSGLMESTTSSKLECSTCNWEGSTEEYFEVLKKKTPVKGRT